VEVEAGHSVTTEKVVSYLRNKNSPPETKRIRRAGQKKDLNFGMKKPPKNVLVPRDLQNEKDQGKPRGQYKTISAIKSKRGRKCNREGRRKVNFSQ